VHQCGFVFLQPRALSGHPTTLQHNETSDKMYEDTWYSYTPEQYNKKDEVFSHSSKHRRKESLLKQPNVSPLHDGRNSQTESQAGEK